MNTVENERVGDLARQFLTRFVSLSDVQADTLTLWALHTHCWTAAQATPYMSISSTGPGSGKTRLLEVLEMLVSNPWLTGRVTGPALARKIDAERPTLLLDEVDALFSGAASSQQVLRGVLNTGYKLNGKTSYASGGGYVDLQTFCPKAFAGIGKTLPRTVADRSVPIVLRKRTAFEHVERLRFREVQEEARVPRMMMARFGAQFLSVLELARPEIPQELGDRQADVWEPLLAVADVLGGSWRERAREASVELSAPSNDADTDGEVFRLLLDCRSVFESFGTERLQTSTLIDGLVSLGTGWENVAGRPLDARGLSDGLRSFGVGPGKMRFGRQTLQGYSRVSFESAWRLVPGVVGVVGVPGVPGVVDEGWGVV